MQPFEELNAGISHLSYVKDEAIEGRVPWSEVWRVIREIGSAFRHVSYPSKAAKDGAWSAYQELVDEVRSAQDTNRLDVERQASEIAHALDDLEREIEYATRDNKLWRSVWTHIEEIGAEFKRKRFPSRSSREALWSRYSTLVSQVKEQQEAHRRQKESWAEQARVLNQRVDGLEERVNNTEYSQEHGKWRSIWDFVRDITDEFQHTRFPSRQEREIAWSRFQNIVRRIKDTQNQERQSREQFNTRSATLRDQIIRTAMDTDLPGENIIGQAIMAPFKMIADVATIMGTVGLVQPDNGEREWKATLQRCSARLQEAREELGRNKDELTGRHKKEIYSVLDERKERLNSAWAEYKEAKHETYERRRTAHEQRTREHNQRVQQQISKLEARLVRLNDVLSRKEDHLSELYDKRATARNENFASRVDGWIAEESSKIADVRQTIREVEGWLEEARGNIWD